MLAVGFEKVPKKRSFPSIQFHHFQMQPGSLENSREHLDDRVLPVDKHIEVKMTKIGGINDKMRVFS